jgi:hypothetical protein
MDDPRRTQARQLAVQLSPETVPWEPSPSPCSSAHPCGSGRDPMASRSVGEHVMSRAPPPVPHEPSDRTASNICPAQRPGNAAARTAARSRKRVSQVGKSPPDTLFGPLNDENTDQGSGHPWRARGTRGRHHRSIVPVSFVLRFGTRSDEPRFGPGRDRLNATLPAPPTARCGVEPFAGLTPPL